MGSTRLPNKSLALLAGKPLLQHVIERVKAAEYVMNVCVATTSNDADDPIEKLCSELGVDCYRGSEDDVLARFYWCSQRYADCPVIIRITGDDPYKDPKLIDHAVEAFCVAWTDHKEGEPQCHYLHLGGMTWALGCDVEVFTREALTEAHRNASDPFDREHCTAYMARVLGCWQIKDNPIRATMTARHTIDTPEDLEYARAVYNSLYESNPLFGYSDVIEAGF
jgi:spore coat polysaccharide biosynthesis protein SpsF